MPLPRPKRTNQSNDDRQSYHPQALIRPPQNPQMNSTMNRGFNQNKLAGAAAMDIQTNNFAMPNSTKNKNYHALVAGVTGFNNMGRNNQR